MQRERDAPFDGHLVRRRTPGSLDPVVRDAVRARLRGNLGIVGIDKERELCLVEILRILHASRAFDAIGVVEQHSEIANAPDAGFRTYRWLPGLDARIAEYAFLRLARGPVVINLLVRAS